MSDPDESPAVDSNLSSSDAPRRFRLGISPSFPRLHIDSHDHPFTVDGASFIGKNVGCMMTVSRAVERFLMHVKITRSHATYRYYCFYTQLILHVFQDDAIDQMDEDHLLFLVATIKEKSPTIKNATLNKLIGTFKYVMKYNLKKELTFHRLKETQKIIPTIPEETVHQIFEYLGGQSDNHALKNLLMLALLIDTGMRINELIHLHVEDVDLNERIIFLKMTKTRAERYTFFTERTLTILKRYLSVFQPEHLLFFQREKRNKISLTSIESNLYRLKNKLGIKDNITPHKWRHTFATTFLSRGGDLETLRLILGHTNLKTTQKYLHLKKTDLFKNYRKIMV